MNYPSILKVKYQNETQPSNVNHTEHVFKSVFKWYRPFWSYEGSIQHLNQDNNTTTSATPDVNPQKEAPKDAKKMAKANKKKRKVNKKRINREPTTPANDEIEREE